MRLLYVVQRYGAAVAGGAEVHCRQFATMLASRGHDVHVVTSCAQSYVDWANVFPPGTSELDGVHVHRLPVKRARDDRTFGPLNARVVWGRKPVALHLQHEWMRVQGPYIDELSGWMSERAESYDAVICFTYLYYTTWAALRAASGRTVTVLHPTAHDEPPIYLPLFDAMFRLPTAFAFSTEEEAHFVSRRFGISPFNEIVGIGTDLDVVGDVERFRNEYSVHDPYVVYVGRLDPGKGSDELFDFFTAYKQRRPGPLKLVLVGDPVRPLPPHPDVILTGFVDEWAKHAALAGAEVFMQPSYFESFSMGLSEAWVHSRPALVQGHCDVIVGQSRRSGGGIPYRGYAEFEAALDLLLDDPDLAQRMGAAGRRYVETRYDWSTVMDKYESLLMYLAWRRSVAAPVSAG